MKIAILTSKKQWFIPYAEELCNRIQDAKLFYHHQKISNKYNIVFILSYHAIIERKYLKLHQHNIVIHESALPQGKGWSPLFWQVLEGKNEISFTMFEASSGVDNGDIYMQEILELTGYELNAELREKQAKKIISMCLNFVQYHKQYIPAKPQLGVGGFYPKRTQKDSELDINKTIKEQFNLLRIVDNKEYPAFFELDKHKYGISIKKIS